MGIFDKFFNKNVSSTRFQMITDTGNGFYSWNGKMYHSDIIRSCIRPKAKAIGKLTAKHIRNNSKEGLKVNPDVYMRFLLEEPNPYMTGQMMLEKVVTQLQLNNNAFIYIHRDEYDYPVELYPVPAVAVEAIYDKQGFLYLKVTMVNGKVVTYPYKDIIHIRQDYNQNDIFGESPASALKPLMEIINTTDQGIVKAIKNGSAVKWLLKFNQSLRPEDIQKQTKEFVDNFLSIDSEFGGAAAADAKYDAKQVDPKDYVPNATQTEKTVQRLYSFFNTNEKIIQSKYNEDEWNSYYESEIEPLAIQLSNEFTRKLFTRKERGFGNKIVFETVNLQYASMSTKLNLVHMVDRGALVPNEWRQILGFGPIKGGDEPIRRLDTAVVDNKPPNEPKVE
ncbi:phage portal protein [Romboutsia sp.]|uniref:phage portal protein n=1 Tax=Romboutsia sp. TaxID=1965302 RepID=UPI002CC95791|nr:phage portal protein [Romboutsia sp.]HSQ88091.1 phage portal protein [Romboutsia sp.]